LAKELQHPVVQALIKGGIPAMQDYYKSLTHSLDPVNKAIYILINSSTIFEPEELKPLLKQTEIPIKDKIDSNLYILFLYYRSRLVIYVTQPYEVQSLWKQAESMVNKHTPNELKAMVVAMKGFVSFYKGDLENNIASIEQEISLQKKGTFNYYTLIGKKSRAQAYMGRLKPYSKQFLSLGQSSSEKLSRLIPVYKFINAKESGDINEAQLFLNEIQKEYAKYKFILPSTFKHMQQQLKLFLGNLERFEYQDLNIYNKMLYHWKYNQPGKALEELKIYINEQVEDIIEDDEFIYNNFKIKEYIIQAELGVGNFKAAKQHLIWLKNIPGYLNDDLEYDFFRMEVMSGNDNLAAKHLARYLKILKKYKKETLLDLQISLSNELSITDFMKIYKMAELLIKEKKSDKESTNSPSKEMDIGALRIKGESVFSESLKETIKLYSTLDAHVLITGDTGTGKELVARALHEESQRSDKQYIAVNCGAISDTLLESELFGHVAGAFTGAAKSRKGLFEEAAEGTLFLDEIGEVSPKIQVALLRVLENNEVRPVGSSTPKKIYCRIVAATNADLMQKTSEGTFRKDLLYRLQKLEIKIPALKNREEDIIPLALHFLNENREGHVPASLSPDLKKSLKKLPWHGNIRELKNTIDRMRMLNSDKIKYSLEDLKNDSKFDIAFDWDKKEETILIQNDNSQTEEIKQIGEISNLEFNSKDKIEQIINQGNATEQRINNLKTIFQQYPKLTRKQIAEILMIDRSTATKYLTILCEENYIEKIKPSASVRSHYFLLKN